MIHIIRLTSEDAMNLVVALGYAQGAIMKETGEAGFVDVVDRILVQLGGVNYTYGKPIAEVIRDLAAQGIIVEDLWSEK